MVVLTLKAKNDHLKKVASTRDPIKAISEFVWNALDADATRVAVEFSRNGLGGLEAIIIRDNGWGISRSRAEHDFESLGDSWKLQTSRTPALGRVIHGKEGQGRLRFYSLALQAVWDSVYSEKDKTNKLRISIDADSLQTSNVSEPESVDPHSETGTIVTLAPLRDTFDWLPSEQARLELSATFAPYIIQYADVELLYDGHLIDPRCTIDRQHTFKTQSVVCPGRTVRDLSLKVIEWRDGSESRKIHLGGQNGVVLGSQAANISAPGFSFSVYAYSEFFQEIANANLLEFDGLSDPDFARVMEYIRDEVGDYFRQRQAEKSGELIQELKEAGIYPYHGEPKDEVEKRERQVFDIATHAVSSYSRDFKRADAQLKKITLGLLREAVGRNPESVSRILRAVFNLPKVRQDEFSQLLEKTELGNIIAASNVISDRIVSLQVLREVVFDPKHRRTIKERGELDVLIKDNTWLFGESFHMTMAESGLTKVMKRVSDDLAAKYSKRLRGRKPDGKIGRVDNFMGRIVPHGDAKHREYLLIELKRPSITVGRKELDQLEDYVTALVSQPDFVSASTSWNFFLVTTEYDGIVANRITQAGRAQGLFIERPGYKVWVRTWAEIVRNAEARLRFVEEKLRINVSAEEIEERIAQLKASILRTDRCNVETCPD